MNISNKHIRFFFSNKDFWGEFFSWVFKIVLWSLFKSQESNDYCFSKSSEVNKSLSSSEPPGSFELKAFWLNLFETFTKLSYNLFKKSPLITNNKSFLKRTPAIICEVIDSFLSNLPDYCYSTVFSLSWLARSQDVNSRFPSSFVCCCENKERRKGFNVKEFSLAIFNLYVNNPENKLLNVNATPKHFLCNFPGKCQSVYIKLQNFQFCILFCVVPK